VRNALVLPRRGFALALLMGIVALLAAVAVAVTQASRSSMQQVQAVGDIQALYAQAQLIRTKILKCSFDHPEGNNGSGFRLSLPAAPTADTAVSALTCPGASAGQAGLWTGTDAVWLPNPPSGFGGGWSYRNDATSARIFIQANDASGLPTLSALAARFSASEAAVNASTFTFTLHIQS
jgi:type II secretory pathway pseudopilin PulG